MKRKYKHVHFDAGPGPAKERPIYDCVDGRDGTVLGIVFYLYGYKEYVFEPRPGSVFNTLYLANVIDFMKQLK